MIEIDASSLIGSCGIWSVLPAITAYRRVRGEQPLHDVAVRYWEKLYHQIEYTHILTSDTLIAFILRQLFSPSEFLYTNNEYVFKHLF